MIHVFSGHPLAYEDHPDISAADPDMGWPREATLASQDLLIGEARNVLWQIQGINRNPAADLIIITQAIILLEGRSEDDNGAIPWNGLCTCSWGYWKDFDGEIKQDRAGCSIGRIHPNDSDTFDQCQAIGHQEPLKRIDASAVRDIDLYIVLNRYIGPNRR
jgi:hypothetical protein